MRQKIRKDVAREYPENDTVPQSLLEVIESQEAPEQPESKRRRFFHEKNATPGDGSRDLSECFNDIRPDSICMDKDATSCIDPATRRERAVERCGDLQVVVQQQGREIVQFHPKYLSQILPLTIPRMVSGPDFFPHTPWRRHYDDAPKISAPQFCAAFARRVEAPCRTDWTALPILRSVSYKFLAEHTMSTVAPVFGKSNAASQVQTADLVKAAQRLYEVLHHGFTGTGVHRVPINGDTTRLPFANGLSPLELSSFL